MAKRILDTRINSEIVSNKVVFSWSFSNFSVENLLEGAIISPAFKSFSTDLHLRISLTSDQQIQLQLFLSNYEYPPRISSCLIGFFCTDGNNKLHSKLFPAPVKSTDIFYAISTDTLKKDCISDKELRVGCTLTFSTIKHTHVQQITQTAVNENKDGSNQGQTILAENIGNILEDSRFSDVTLRVGEESFQAHKAILSSRSKVFDGMFQSGMKESQESVVEIVDMKPTILKEMLQYVYAGAIGALSMDRAVDLYVGADRYDLQELKGWCKKFILQHISFEDVCRVALIADLHSDKELSKASKCVFKKSSKKILASEEWREFKNQHPILYSELVESALLNNRQV